MPIVTLLTDFGRRDYYVAAVKGVVLGLAPGTTIVDLGHEVDAGDVEGAAFLLGAAAPNFPPGTVHLAVVDPGVGTSRRLLAADRGGSRFVAPDNGVLSSVLEGADVHSIDAAELFRSGPGATFHGRDRLAPAAAWLARGGSLRQLGPEVRDPHLLQLPQPCRVGSQLHGRIAQVDRFGNLITDVPSAWLAGSLVRARVGRHEAQRFATHYAALDPGEAGLLPGSLGTLELALRGASLAAAWGAVRGTDVEIQFR